MPKKTLERAAKHEGRFSSVRQSADAQRSRMDARERSFSRREFLRAARLHNLFLNVDAAVQKGACVRPEIRKRARRTRGRSAGRLATLFYDWKRQGKKPDALLRRFHAHNALPKLYLLQFVDVCFADGLLSMYQAWKGLGIHTRITSRKPVRWPGYGTFIRALSQKQRQAIRSYHRAQFNVQRARKAAQRCLQNLT